MHSVPMQSDDDDKMQRNIILRRVRILRVMLSVAIMVAVQPLNRDYLYLYLSSRYLRNLRKEVFAYEYL